MVNFIDGRAGACASVSSGWTSPPSMPPIVNNIRMRRVFTRTPEVISGGCSTFRERNVTLHDKAMAVRSVTTMSRATPISGSSTALFDGCISSSSSAPRPVRSAVRFRNENAPQFRNAAVSLSSKGEVLFGLVTSQPRSNRWEVGFVNLGQLGKRRRWGAVGSVRADATAVVETEGAPEKSSEEKQLITKLLSLVEGSDRGAQFRTEEHTQVADLVGQLEQYGIPEPLRSPLIFGDWDVAYSSVPTSPGGGYRTWIGRLIFRTRAMIQAVLKPDIIVNVVQFLLFGFLPGEVELRGKLEPIDQKLIKINFEPPSFQLGPFKFQYGKISSVKISTIYLDDTLRLGRGSRGTVFVFTRR